MKFLIYFSGLAILTRFSVSEVKCDHEDEYHWRVYTGSVPKDAILGGVDKRGQQFYIGQVYLPKDLLPVPIFFNTSTMINGQHVYILCSPVKQQLFWKSTTSCDLSKLKEHPVAYGRYIDMSMYVGRVAQDKGHELGKVFPDEHDKRGLWISSESNFGYQDRRFLRYEVLTYKCPDKCRDYCWRDFKGELPENSIKGGVNLKGETFYIGQAYFRKSGLLPVSLLMSTKKATGTHSEIITDTNVNIKILCGNSENFVWRPTNTTDLPSILKKYQVIPGGAEIGEQIYFGRFKTEKNRIVFGKIFKGKGLWGLWNPTSDEKCPSGQIHNFEVLTYECNVY